MVSPIVKYTVHGAECAFCGGEIFVEFMDDEEDWNPDITSEEKIDE